MCCKPEKHLGSSMNVQRKVVVTKGPIFARDARSPVIALAAARKPIGKVIKKVRIGMHDCRSGSILF